MNEIGALDRRVTLQSFTEPTGGDPTGAYADAATVWAERLDARGARRFVASGSVAEATQAYRIRYRADVDPTWRVKDGTELWEIQGTLPIDRNVWLILSVRRLDPEHAN